MENFLAEGNILGLSNKSEFISKIKGVSIILARWYVEK
jgi:hypothetical protein